MAAAGRIYAQQAPSSESQGSLLAKVGVLVLVTLAMASTVESSA